MKTNDSKVITSNSVVNITEKEVKQVFAETNKEVNATKSQESGNKETVNEKEAKVIHEKKISLAQAEKNLVSFIEKLIDENTALICGSLFNEEIQAEFEKQKKELENDKQERNAKILGVMMERFSSVESGANFIEFKNNVSGLRAKAIQEYKEMFEAEKLKEEKRKAIKAQIEALNTVINLPGTVDVVKVAIKAQIEALTNDMNAI